MTICDKIDGSSREGSSRVEIYQEKNLVNDYSLEASLYGAKRRNSLSQKLIKSENSSEYETDRTNPMSKVDKGRNGAYTPEIYCVIGRVTLR